MRAPDGLAELLALQDGLASRDQLAELGVSRWERSRLVADGWIVRVAPRVWRLRGAPDTPHWRLRAGLLCLGEGSCVSFESAARLHGLPGAHPHRVELSVPRRRRSAVVPFVVHSTGAFGPGEVVDVDGLATTSVARTIFDLALAGASDARLAASIAAAVRSGPTTRGELVDHLAASRGSGRAGCRRLERLLG